LPLLLLLVAWFVGMSELLSEPQVINLTLKVINIIILNYFYQIDLPMAWLSLDEADNDLPRILTHLAAALQWLFNQTGAPLFSAHQSPQFPAINVENTNASHN